MMKAILSQEKADKPDEYHEVGMSHRTVVEGSRRQIVARAQEYREHMHCRVRVQLFHRERFYAPEPLETFYV